MKTKMCLLIVAVMSVILVSCGSQTSQQPTAAISLPAGTETILDTSWQWGAIIENQSAPEMVPQKERYTLVVKPDGAYNFVADCNSGSGQYSVNGNNITMTPGVSTLSECGPDSLYSNYLNLLGQITSFTLKDGLLVLTTSDGAAQMVFYNGGPATVQSAAAESSEGVGVDLNSLTVNSQGLYPSFQASLALSSPYDNTQPSGAVGLPGHIQVNFGGAEMLETSPTIYVIPIEDYQNLWESGGDPSVTGIIAKLQSLLAEKPDFAPFGMPVLPFERAKGVNDLAVQGAYLSTNSGEGLRFVGRFAQDQQPLSNSNLFYVYQGISPDGKYLVTFFYPIKTKVLPEDGSVPAEDQQAATQDFNSYLSKKYSELNELSAADFEPNLTVLDEMIKSLVFTSVK